MENITIKIPDWLRETNSSEKMETAEERVNFVLDLAERNIREKSGGPFAAVLFDRKNWKPAACGVNLVFQSKLSSAHAEIIAISIAQQKFNNYDLSEFDLELVSSCEPCEMCTGALIWSGISGLVYSAEKNDAEEIGFDEGDKSVNWKEGYEKREIYVRGPILLERGRKILLDYASKGDIYNPGKNKTK